MQKHIEEIKLELPSKESEQSSLAANQAVGFIAAFAWAIVAYTVMGSVTRDISNALPLNALLLAFIAIALLVVNRWRLLHKRPPNAPIEAHRVSAYYPMSQIWFYLAIVTSAGSQLLFQFNNELVYVSVWLNISSFVPALIGGITVRKAEKSKAERLFLLREIKKSIKSLGGIMK